ncbi:DMT family transporter [Novosphingobium sp.]|uniref:DMT family transporter n=1 Tax=Novosphingobium sp. TaxID=1874826 RepID=UPI0022C590BE|nr:DMT family transporter [Novosphingobium sp.]MCZ8017842.1 DMT family transporter [Novosphingobium sp.]MCZ8033634.1 DMT family transporter [Novosphingobium sp.]MCZ8050990.1 DMT family transporter [Novosphingobium sp.]MCZ8059336.1 DMT family transporter [Novosphingobium sp.]MCZ8231174.1 DMT family transporter [Novosphingobium sp.]
MSLRDFLLLVGICLIWATNNVVSKVVVSDWQVPPLLYAAVRFVLVAALTLPWLRPIPRPAWRIVTVGLLMGGGSFALLFMALQTVSPSAAAVVSQAGVPITTLLSILILGERIHWRRGLGITLTLIGVLVVVWEPGFAISAGLLLVLAAAASGSLGAVLMKQMGDIAPLRFQAWVGMSSALLLAPLTLVLETPDWGQLAAVKWQFMAAVVFSALVVSVGAHTLYYVLIARYEANLIAPLTLITPLATIGLGVVITNDQLDTQMIVGSAIALTGVLIVALRRTKAPIAEAQEHS